MRLRFGRPSFLILIFFAIMVGVGFYLLDNRSTPAEPPAVSTLIAANTPLPPTALPTLLPPPQPTASLSGNRREMPDDTTLFIPRAGIFSRVIESYLDGQSWDISQLRTNVGHLEGTSWLDQPGNVVLSGHVEMSDGRPGVFANLEELTNDDIIVLTSNGEEYRYIITETYTTTPNDLQPLMPTATDQLTLITCDSYDFFSDSYLERTIIVAHRL
ncbi:MAG: sortase [Anaerolineae bacterium]|nr:sortase [Anaerolineae bacterium]MDQ7035314.1 sortase [Anaerolineae bacterium]